MNMSSIKNIDNVNNMKGDLNEDCENDDHQSGRDKDVGSLHHLTGGRNMYT